MKSHALWTNALFIACLAPGCGQPALVNDDSATPGQDSGPASDAAPDAPRDAGFDSGVSDAAPIDAPADANDVDAFVDTDGDGVADAADCDPADPGVARTGTRACTNSCGSGTQTCTDGVWAVCSAPTDCACTTPGATRVADCGMCGTQGQTCTAGVWTPNSACLGQGECNAGMSETMNLSRCGQQQRLCDSSCHWGSWVTTVPRGECTAGEMECLGPGFPPLPCWCNSMCMCDPAPPGAC